MKTAMNTPLHPSVDLEIISVARKLSSKTAMLKYAKEAVLWPFKINLRPIQRGPYLTLTYFVAWSRISLDTHSPRWLTYIR